MVPFKGFYILCAIGIHKWSLIYDSDEEKTYSCKKCGHHKWYKKNE